MNTVAKGKILQKKAKSILESEEYIVEEANPKLQFIGKGRVISKKHDFFKKWDLIAVGHGHVKFVQVSVWSLGSEKIKQVYGFPVGNYAQEIWLWDGHGRKGHFKILLSTDMFQWTGKCKLPIKNKKVEEISE